MTDKMEMPDVICVETEQREYFFEEGNRDAERWNTETYHHDRIVEALRKENEELKAKLEKAKRGLSLIAWQNEETWSQQTARTTLEEI